MALDAEFFATGRRTLSRALLSEVLDSMGLAQHAMDCGLRPLDDSRILFGRPRTGQYAEVSEHEAGTNTYAVEIALIDDLPADDVVDPDCGGLAVVPGDLAFGDVDGVLAIPPEAAEEAIRLAQEKAAGEDRVRQALQSGESLAEVLERFGIL